MSAVKPLAEDPVRPKPPRSVVTQRKHWQRLLDDLFGGRIPRHCEWEAPEQILSVLNQMAAHVADTRLSFPDQAGINLLGAQDSHEPDCIELLLHEPPGKGRSAPRRATVVKPNVLAFDGFHNAGEWAYFRLETHPLEPALPEASTDDTREEVVEIAPDWYVEREVWDAGFYRNQDRKVRLPKTSRLITRTLRGAAVIFGKGSPFIGQEDYADRHARMSLTAFRKLVATVKYESEF